MSKNSSFAGAFFSLAGVLYSGSELLDVANSIDTLTMPVILLVVCIFALGAFSGPCLRHVWEGTPSANDVASGFVASLADPAAGKATARYPWEINQQ